MLRFLPLIIIVMLMIYCVVDVAQSRSDEVRIAPRWLWAAAVILLPLFGAVTWLFWGRPNAASIAEAEADRHPAAPDDDPDFLRRLR
ncbi:PLD nuclease N-terminal domain-containing protein [Enemella evansiae]|uniref:Cardiolipin synthase N-terminal domain-containing protein n=1 Tax=Enemella evansiae TaxID=2016499 RepID=A0A255GJD3_9ACTN|nr:PLD nuclease N-terminal domain-containing protein [Enemella evansiae]PFG68665.1 phospholipase D-like protein [Propionibacteriaceae bacterium ES.041]OYN94045.1 hypothetical protein CGZ96_19455 [Enemella evansiae]OYN95331.1 hypothetical protein CGZ95_16475 [Enemella evansiae]OYO03433.1 hypothetical protein CGZ97_08240 [Enemella evansiae]OYO09327.1 hypothetical protein BI335_18500 [Enemella evansiae]